MPSKEVMRKALTLYKNDNVLPLRISGLSYYFVVRSKTKRYEVRFLKKDHSKYNCTCLHGSGPRFKRRPVDECCSHWVACLIWNFREKKIVPTMEVSKYGEFRGIES